MSEHKETNLVQEILRGEALEAGFVAVAAAEFYS
jgi:hypothetical protein